jgi:hypothetical protein
VVPRALLLSPFVIAWGRGFAIQVLGRDVHPIPTREQDRDGVHGRRVDGRGGVAETEQDVSVQQVVRHQS